MTAPGPNYSAAAIVALRYTLALARDDREAAEQATWEMGRFEPGIVVGALADTLIRFVKAGSHGSDEGAAALIEQWLQSVLDANDETAEQ